MTISSLQRSIAEVGFPAAPPSGDSRRGRFREPSSSTSVHCKMCRLAPPSACELLPLEVYVSLEGSTYHGRLYNAVRPLRGTPHLILVSHARSFRIQRSHSLSFAIDKISPRRGPGRAPVLHTWCWGPSPTESISLPQLFSLCMHLNTIFVHILFCLS